MRKVLLRTAVGATMAGLGLLLPIRYDAKTAIAANEACGEIPCCSELGSVCGILDDYTPHHYRTADGTCPRP